MPHVRDYHKSSQRQALVKVHGIEGYFMTKTGGNVTSAVSKVYDGGRKSPSLLSSPSEAENVTVSRAYRTFRDDRVLREMRKNVGNWRTTVSVQPTNADLDRVGKPVVYPNALLVSMSEPDVDAGSGEPMIFSLEFAIATVSSGN